jgi:hypothetical protein
VNLTDIVYARLAMADTPPSDVDPITGKGPEWGKAAPIGLLVILLMGIATFFLLRSMTRKIKNVPGSFDPPDLGPLPGAGPADQPPAMTMNEQAEREQAGPEPGAPGLVDDRTR